MERAANSLPPDVAEHELRRALNALVADHVLLVYGVLAPLFAIFAASDRFLYPGEAGVSIATWDAACMALLAVGLLILWRRGVTPRNAHPALFVAGLIPVGTILHSLHVTADPAQTLFLILVVIGAGSLILSAAWFAPILAIAVIGWMGVAATRGDGSWLLYGFALLAAGVVGGLILTVRIRSYTRLEILNFAANKASIERDLREEALESAVKLAWESEERYRRLVDQARDAFIVHDEGKVTFANPAAVRLFGASSQDALLGLDPRGLVDLDGVRVDFASARATRLDGEKVDVEVTSQPISYLGRPADQIVIRDLTDRKRAAAEERVALERLGEIARLKELDRMKTQFVNTLSHELRTPLTPIKVQLHLLKTAHATGDVERQKKATDMLDRNVARMGGLIDELLEVARLQAGNLKLDRADVDLEETLAEALESFRDVAKQNGVDVVTRLEHGLHVEADARRLTQVMYNLLNNALKFTPEGGRIVVDAHQEEGQAVVSVTDTGVGIKPEDIARLFEPFSQVHDTMQKTNSGTGLGLYICKGIVEGHGGSIRCESKGPGKGTTFSFAIPADGTHADEEDAA